MVKYRILLRQTERYWFEITTVSKCIEGLGLGLGFEVNFLLLVQSMQVEVSCKADTVSNQPSTAKVMEPVPCYTDDTMITEIVIGKTQIQSKCHGGFSRNSGDCAQPVAPPEIHVS
jgi:hypothetical protein